MNTTQILQLHKLTVKHFNDILDSYKIYGNVQNKLKLIKDNIHICATFEAPGLIVLDQAAPIQGKEEWNKLFAAMRKSHDIVNKYLAEFSDSDQYKDKFKLVFETVLRVELYREYSSIEANIHHRENFGHSMISSFINAEINQFIKLTPSLTRDEKNIVRRLKLDLEKLGASFEKNLVKLNSLDHKEIIKDLAFQYELEAMQLIHSFQINYKSQKSLVPLFLALLPVITGIGIIYTVGALIYRAKVGHYLFFDTPSLRKIPESEQLIQKEDINRYKLFTASPESTAEIVNEPTNSQSI
ncbi:MAG: hypothetical protein H0U70_09565 [Tatlockia sp.]|nr:hypothetical protein [Tatlockia sp.]